MKCAVVGGGINGVMSAWALARRGHAVELFERGDLMGATSSASTKLIHGGLRYLEHGEFRLVCQSLHERAFWLRNAPHLVHPLELLVPVYRESRRSRLVLGAGLMLYDLLAGSARLARHSWLSPAEIAQRCPELEPTDMLGAFSFHDGQMDDHALGLWAAEQATRAGVQIRTHAEAERVSASGKLTVAGKLAAYDAVVNVAGPWAEQLLQRSGIESRHRLDLVRGSHVLLKREARNAYLVEAPGEERVCFILPYQGQTLVGTTEVRQGLDDRIVCSEAERDYLLAVHNRYIRPRADVEDIASTFAGVRPLLHSTAKTSRASREYAIETRGRLITVFGGKWTTARLLGEEVASRVDALAR